METKYEEALAKARAGKSLEEVFPELKESEDERIRKAVLKGIEYLEMDEGWDSIGDIDILDAKQWLEKQKENIEKEYVFRPLVGTDINSAALQAIRRVNKGDSLVLAFNGAYIPVRKGCNANKIVDIYDAFIKKQKEQKPEEWNDTDMKEARNNLISVCRDWEYGKQTTLLPIVAVRARYFLEHLTEPKPSEWSEEDEHGRTDAIYFLESAKKHYADTSEIEKTIAWLKSLRPDSYKNCNSHWKPSEEQMEALKRVFYNRPIGSAELSEIESLYNDLKKLK